MKDSDSHKKIARIFYARVDKFRRKEQKYAYLEVTTISLESMRIVRALPDPGILSG